MAAHLPRHWTWRRDWPGRSGTAGGWWWWPGPVVIHTGGGPALASLVRGGYVSGLLAGNALAVHDVESALFGTSLGIALDTGKPVFEGHRNHIRAINAVFAHGSISAAVEAGAVEVGVMYECVKGGVPFVLAGSLRDDGPASGDGDGHAGRAARLRGSW